MSIKRQLLKHVDVEGISISGWSLDEVIKRIKQVQKSAKSDGYTDLYFEVHYEEDGGIYSGVKGSRLESLEEAKKRVKEDLSIKKTQEEYERKELERLTKKFKEKG